MSSPMVTVEGLYDGKQIRPLHAVKNKAFVYEVTDEIRQGLAKAGLNEEKILEELKTSWCKAIE